MRTFSILPPCLAAILALACSGCVIGFGEPEKRGSVVDGLEVETELTLRTLDSEDTAAALPALDTLAKNAARTDELGLRIEATLLTARTLNAEAALHPPAQAAELRRAALRHAAAALREASDWRRFDPAAKEAALLLYDARILHARLSAIGNADAGTDADAAANAAEPLVPLLAAAAAEARRQNDPARETAWQLALCGEQLAGGSPGEARASLAAAKLAFGKIDPESEALRLALAETEADIALRDGRAAEAERLYNAALDTARTLRRRPDLRRILLKLSAAAGQSAEQSAARPPDPDAAARADWYRRRAEGITQSQSTVQTAPRTSPRRATQTAPRSGSAPRATPQGEPRATPRAVPQGAAK